MYMIPRSITVGLGLLLAVGSVAANVRAADRPVSINPSIEKLAKGDGHFRMDVTIEIEDGWHMYDKVKINSPNTVTTVELKLPEGVEAVGDWSRPVGLPSENDPETFIYQGAIQFSHELKATNREPAKVNVEVSYQVCRGEVCQPPQRQVVSATIPAIGEGKNQDSQFDNKTFSAPKRLMVGDQPLNSAANQMYPSPAMYDVDNDGDLELVVGDIFGSLNVYENTNSTDTGEPAWSSHTPLKSKDGKPIKVSNW